MAVTLRKYLNSKLKEKGLTVAQAKKNAGKYKSISAAKKAGSLYYTNKDGKVMIAAYAEDLKMPMKIWELNSSRSHFQIFQHLFLHTILLLQQNAHQICQDLMVCVLGIELKTQMILMIFI